MHASVRAFLNQIIDYAGLFPPAKLPLDVALNNYLRYRKESPHAWMLGRFVCPTALLAELLVLAKSHPDASLLSLTALGTQSSQASDFASGFETDVRSIEDFRRAWERENIVDSFEVAPPKSGDMAQIGSQLLHVSSRLREVQMQGFLEVPLSPSWRDDVEAAAVQLHQVRYADHHGTLGMKLRCGGVGLDAFPDETQVAHFIVRCRDWQVLWKATAGLHHPRRHFDKSLSLWHHGFLNVFGAGLLSATNPLAEADIVAILADRDGQHFRFEGERMFWKHWSCTTAQIAEHRGSWATSFGSCSFEEPVEDLLALGLLDANG